MAASWTRSSSSQRLTEDWTTYLADYSTGKLPMCMLGWNADYADPDNFLTTYFCRSAVGDLGWDAPEVVQALNDTPRPPTRLNATGGFNLLGDASPDVLDPRLTNT